MYRFFTHDWRLVEPLNTRGTLGVHFPMQTSYVITFLLILRQRHCCIRDSSSLETRGVHSFLQRQKQQFYQIQSSRIFLCSFQILVPHDINQNKVVVDSKSTQPSIPSTVTRATL